MDQTRHRMLDFNSFIPHKLPKITIRIENKESEKKEIEISKVNALIIYTV